MGEVVSQAEYARRHGKSRQWATRLKTEGRLVLTSKGKVDVAASDAALAATLDPAKQRPRKTIKKERRRAKASPSAPDPLEATAAGGEYASASAAHKAAQAALAQTKLDILRGKLLDRRMVELAAFDAMRVTRDRILAMPARLAPMLAGLSDRREVHNLLKKELTGVLHDLADALRRLPDDDGSDGGGGKSARGT